MIPSIIIHESARIKSSGEKIIYVTLPEEVKMERKTVPVYRIYKLQCGLGTYELHVPEIQSEIGKTLIVPAYMVPGRPYPIYVYIYAVTVYASNPAMGQREASKQTREYFGLASFSHTTLGRAMKKIELLIHEEENETEAPKGPQQPAPTSFPNAEEMRGRKKAVLSYMREAAGAEWLSLPEPKPRQLRPPYISGFIEACHRISANTYKKYRRLLL